MSATQKDYFVLNLLACEEKAYDKFVYGDSQPAGMTDKPSLSDFKKLLADRGASNVVVVQMDHTDGIYFVFVNIDAAKAEESAPDFKLGSIATFQGTPSEVAAVEAERADAMSDQLLVRANVISHCFKAFPLIKEELKKKGAQVNDRLFADIAATAEKFDDTSDGIMDDLTMDPTMDKVRSGQNALNEWSQKVFAAVKAVFSEVPVPKPVPSAPVPSGSNQIVPVCENCKSLRAELDKANSRISQLEKQLQEALDSKQKVEDENAGLKESLDSLKKENEELQKKIPKPVPPPPSEPSVLNSVIEFAPKKFVKDKKEEILFFVMRGYYKHYYIAKNCAEELKLDKTKPVKLTIESFESHTHTDEEEEGRIAREYYVPKGEDFFICRGKVAPADAKVLPNK